MADVYKRQLYDWIFSSFSVRPTLSTDTPIHEVAVTHSAETDTLAPVSYTHLCGCVADAAISA